MGENLQRLNRWHWIFVITLTLSIVLLLAKSTYYINYWPSDSYTPYIPTAARLSQLQFLSQMHELPISGQLKLTMHGKEALILGIAIMQRILNDYQSLYPNVLLLILATGVSSILIYSIFGKLFNASVGMLAYLLFTGCFWTYMYVLQGAHQPLALMNCLIVIIFLLQGGRRPLMEVLAGIFLGFMLFSSPTSPLYLPYILGIFLYRTFFQEASPAGNARSIGLAILRIFLGGVATFLVFTLPDPINSIKGFLRFLKFSQVGNNFNIYYEYLYEYYPIPLRFRGAGVVWIFKYFFLIMPFLFTAYCLSAGYLVKKFFRKPLLIGVVVLSLLPPLATEISHVAQFGRNYFPWLIGLIFLTCMAAHLLALDLKKSSSKILRFGFAAVLAAFLSGHLLYNGWLFFNDIFPSKMTTTWVHDWLIKNGYRKVYIYADHPYNLNLVKFLNNPKQKEKITVEEIESLREAKDGLIYLLPITGKSIYRECRENDFYKDPELTELHQSAEFPKYVVASFKTLASSKVWTQEEEICTYLDLVLGLINNEDRRKGLAHLVDAQRLQQEWYPAKTR